ncbi:MAG: PQQ-binding-like beta-propeller repeat protein [Limisphaerales bacterium]
MNHPRPKTRPLRPAHSRRRPTPGILPLLPILFALFGTIPLAAPADWPTHRANAGRTGFTPSQLAFPLHPAWKRDLLRPSPAWSPPARRSYWQRLEHLSARVAEDHAFVPVISGGAILCASSSDDHVRCFEATSGRLRWIFPTDGPVRYAPAVAGNLACFGSDDGSIYAVRLDDGSLAWRSRPGPEDRRIPGNERLISAWPVRSGLLVDGDVVFATAGLYPQQGAFACALNLGDGSVRWRRNLDVSPEGYLLATGNLLVVPTGRASPIGLDRETGTPRRTFDTGGGTYAVASQEEIFGGPGNDGTLTAVGTQSSQRLLTVRGRNLVADGPRIHLLEGGRLRTIDRARQAAVQRRIRDIENRLRALQADSKSRPGPETHSETVRTEISTLGDQLATERRHLDACELWAVPCPDDLALIGTRNALIAGGTNRVVAFAAADGRRLWESEVDGRALALAASDGLLVVTTDSGVLQIFRETTSEPAKPSLRSDPTTQRSRPSPSLPSASSVTTRFASLLQDLASARGYALVAGLGSGELIERLLAQTDFQIVAIDSEPGRVARARTEWLDRGLYGTRITAHLVPAGTLPFTDYFANLVIAEAALEGRGSIAWPKDELHRITRPFGGLLWIDPGAAPTARGPLEGAGEWTHQFGNTANTARSGDRRISPNFELQWFGGPGPDQMVDRHLRGPAPLATDGLLLVPGENRILAVDAYNGTVRWQRDLPGSQRYTMPYDAGYLSLDGSRLAAAVRDACWILDTGTGRLVHQWPVPQPSGVTTAVHWGYTALLGNRLFGTAQKASASRTHPSYEQIDVDYNNDQPLVTGHSFFQMDVETGRTIWHRHRGVLLNTSLTLAENNLVLVEARDPDLHRHATGRIPLNRLLTGDPWIVAIDTRTGETAWERPLDGPLVNSRNVLYVACSGDHLILLGSHRDASNDTRYNVESRRLSDGSVRWRADHLARVPGEFTHGEQVHHPVLLDDLLVAEPAVYELATGRRLTDHGGAQPWNLVRPGHSCGTLSAAGSCLFFRAGNPTVLDLQANIRSGQAATKLSPSRTGCWINMIPAGGLLLIPEASAGCVCQFSLQTSMAFLPKLP